LKKNGKSGLKNDQIRSVSLKRERFFSFVGNFVEMKIGTFSGGMS
jgi:hypothetical protein